MSNSAGVTAPSDTPTLPNLFESLGGTAPSMAPGAVASGASGAPARRDTLLEPVEWLVSFDDDDDDIVGVAKAIESAEALDLDDAEEIETSEIRRVASVPPPLPQAAAPAAPFPLVSRLTGTKPAAKPSSAPAPKPTPSAAPTLRIVSPPRSRFWGDSRDEL